MYPPFFFTTTLPPRSSAMGEITSSTPASSSSSPQTHTPPSPPEPLPVSLPLTTATLKLHNSSHNSLPPPVPPPIKPVHVSQRMFYADGSNRLSTLATLYSPPHHHYNSMEIFLASVVGLIASVLLATHYTVDNVIFQLPPMFAFYLILNLAIVRCIVNQAKEQVRSATRRMQKCAYPSSVCCGPISDGGSILINLSKIPFPLTRTVLYTKHHTPTSLVAPD